jgi:hypothetical protein
MKKVLCFVTLFAIILFYGCKKTNNETVTGNCRMQQSSGSLNKMYCFYAGNHTILKMQFIDPPSDTGWENYYYENGHIAYMVRLYKGTQGDTIYYTYNSGKYIEVDEYGYKLKYIYNGMNQLFKIERHEGSKVTDYSNYFYDVNGNCIRCNQYAEHNYSDSIYILTIVTDFEFGGQKNPYSSIGLPPLNSIGSEVGQYLSPNNITKIRTQFVTDSLKLVLVYHYSTFNDNGYPLLFSITDSLNNLMSNESIEYLCP